MAPASVDSKFLHGAEGRRIEEGGKSFEARSDRPGLIVEKVTGVSQDRSFRE
jgi:hypothetical protein